eukprot:gb/GEZN01009246.1/.p1 GENE.gb/GEZN01009246.1/~~gb/GEZN01009246.1/.p1  ORF type:complete len:408 (-),score=58.69 gb/GEZN01009246.1/:27-1250(-)
MSLDYVQLGENPALPLNLLRTAVGSIGFVLASGAGLIRGINILKSGGADQQKSPSFFPTNGVESVTIKAGPPGAVAVVPPPVATESDTSCIFAYGPRDEPGADELKADAAIESAWIYGAVLYIPEGTQDSDVVIPMAVPTGLSENVAKGRLLCFQDNNIASKLAQADQQQNFDPNNNQQFAVKRSVVNAVCKDGGTKAAFFYYTNEVPSGYIEQPAQVKKQKQKPQQTPPPGPEVPLFYRLDLRVGKITQAEKHPNADSMYVEQIDIGEPQTRTICSGMYGKVPQNEFEGSSVIVVANLKPAKLRDIDSYGMVLAASNEDHSVLELVKPSDETPPGTRLFLEGDSEEERKEWVAEKEVNGKKKTSAWALMAPDLGVNGEGIVTYAGRVVRTKEGPITAKTLRNVRVG